MVDGILFYQYRAMDKSAKGVESSAMEKALDFIYSLKNLYSEDSLAEIKVTEIEEEKNYFIFKFDYYVNDMPICVNYNVNKSRLKIQL